MCEFFVKICIKKILIILFFVVFECIEVFFWFVYSLDNKNIKLNIIYIDFNFFIIKYYIIK